VPNPLVALSQVPTPKTRPPRTVSEHRLSVAADRGPVIQPCWLSGVLFGAAISQLPRVGDEVFTLCLHPFYCVVEIGFVIVV
jgi:hypothetical protein